MTFNVCSPRWNNAPAVQGFRDWFSELDQGGPGDGEADVDVEVEA